ncbi:hypothetical protein BGW39_003820 [Mortierella sp. 14UC]|nr:hypothetical protein BGW39_003820 [Mortierella sp. 14UC]
MTQDDTPEENVQALRALVKSTLLPPHAQEDIVFVDYQHDPVTQKEVVLWDDVLLAFNDAIHVRRKAKVVPFLKGTDFRVLEPRRIAAVPGVVLDVMVEGKPTQEVTTLPKLSQQQETSSQDTPQDTPLKDNIASNHNPQYGLEEIAIATLSINENPAVILAASRAPQTDDPGDDNASNGSTDSDFKNTTRGPQLNVDDLDQTRANADLGDVAAQVNLGTMYLEGKVVPQNYQLAMEWYLKAAEQEDLAGQRRVGYMHYMGHGVPQDYTMAMEWYLKAAKQGDAAAQFNIGSLYHKGGGVSRDYKHAAEWFRKSAEQGYDEAQRFLGSLYQSGEGVTLDYTKAMEWYLKASRQGNAQAQADIGFLHYFGQGVPQDFAAALEWNLLAAEQGNVSAQRRLGHMYHHGQSVPQDYSKAMEWYRKAADKGDGFSSNRVGHLYHKGLAVPMDLEKAEDWYLKSHRQGCAKGWTNYSSIWKEIRKIRE